MIRLVILLVFILIAVLIVLAVVGVRKVRRKQVSEQQALAERADQQMAWLKSGDDRGVFGDWSPKPEKEKVPHTVYGHSINIPLPEKRPPCEQCGVESYYTLIPQGSTQPHHLCQRCDVRLKRYLRELAVLKTRLQDSDPIEPGTPVRVSGVGGVQTVTGHCSIVYVSGVENTVTVDSANVIKASGVNNTIIYHSGSPKIFKSGTGNVVKRG